MNQIVFYAKSIWPLRLFPHRIFIDRFQIKVEYQLFFWTKRVMQLPIKDVQSVDVIHGPFSSTLRIEPRGYFEKPMPPIAHLPREMASQARKTIMKLMMAAQKRTGRA